MPNVNFMRIDLEPFCPPGSTAITLQYEMLGQVQTVLLARSVDDVHPMTLEPPKGQVEVFLTEQFIYLSCPPEQIKLAVSGYRF